MLDHPTHDQLRELKLDGMADAFAELQGRDDVGDLSHAEWLGLLIDREAASRSTKKFQARMRAAKLRHVGACIEDVDYRAPRKLDRALFRDLTTSRWVDEHRNLLITGPVRQCLSDHWRSIGSPWARPGLPAPSDTRRAGTANPSSTTACPGSSPSSSWPMATAAFPASSDSS